MSVGKNVKRLRFERDVSNKQIAEAVGVSEAAISMLIHDEKPLSLEKTVKLAEFFGVTVDELIK